MTHVARTTILWLLAALLGAPSQAAWAAPDARAQREIDHLLDFVAASGCRFLRGGVDYDAKEAREHLARKFDTARPMIGSADAFIDHVASASSMTGAAYRVRCGTDELTSKVWLKTELARYRSAARTQ